LRKHTVIIKAEILHHLQRAQEMLTCESDLIDQNKNPDFQSEASKKQKTALQGNCIGLQNFPIGFE